MSNDKEQPRVPPLSEEAKDKARQDIAEEQAAGGQTDDTGGATHDPEEDPEP